MIYKTKPQACIDMPSEANPMLSSFSPVALKELYLSYRVPIIRWLVKTYSVNVEEATELAQQAFVIFVEKSAKRELPEFQTPSNIKSYLFAIAKNKARELKRRLQKTRPLTDGHLGFIEESHTATDDIKQQQISVASQAFRKLGERCQELLRLAVVFKLSMQEIASTLHYENTNTAKTQKYKCLIRLRKLYQQSAPNV